jgi:hypothetical protein
MGLSERDLEHYRHPVIWFRLLRMRALTREALTPEMSSIYTRIATILIESAAPFSILGICLIITCVLNEPFDAAFSLVWGIFCVEFSLSGPLPSFLSLIRTNVKSDCGPLLCQSLSPQMIILRVSMGHERLKETVNEIDTALVFAKPSTIHEQNQECMTMNNTEDPISVPGMPANSSHIPIKTQVSIADVAPLA